MNDYILQLQSHPEIHQAVFWDGANHSNKSIVLDIASLSQLDTLYLIGESTKELNVIKSYIDRTRKQNPDLNHCCKVIISDVSALLKDGILDENYALLFDSCNRVTEITQLIVLHPSKLFGGVWQPNFSPMDVWEAFRCVSEQIYIASYRPDAGPEILDWIRDENMPIELSIIFPMYNVEKYLDECIPSVAAWKADYVEFLFVNDGSPDHSREKILEYSEKDPRVKLIDKPNGGCASARQKGLEVAQGRYVGFVDPDDFVDELMFQSLLYRALVGSYDIAYCGYKEYYNDTHTIKNAQDALGAEYVAGTDNRDRIHELIATCRVAIWRGIYRRSMLDAHNIGFYTELRRFDDLPFKVETFAYAKSVAVVPQYYYYYRLARPGQDVSADDERLYVHFDIFDHLKDRCELIGDPSITDYVQVCKIQTHRYALEKIKDSCFAEYCHKAKKDLPGTDLFSIWYYYRLFKNMVGKVSASYYLMIKFDCPMLVRAVRNSAQKKVIAARKKQESTTERFRKMI